MNEEKHTHLSQLTVERYLLGELDGAALEAVERSTALCAHCAKMVATTEEDDRAFAMRPVPARLAARWVEPRRELRFGRAMALAVPLAAAAAVAMVLWLPRGEVGADDVALPARIGERARDGAVTLKGGAGEAGAPSVELGFYVLRGDDADLGSPGQVLSEGDRIQFWYDVPRDTGAILVGIDGRGAVTRYLPQGPGASRLEAGKGRVVRSSVVLDDASGVERFFLCTGLRDADAAAEVEEAARALARDGADLERTERLPLGCEQASIWIRKE